MVQFVHQQRNQSPHHSHGHDHSHGNRSSSPSKSHLSTASSIQTFWMALVIHSTMEGLGIGAADSYLSQITVVSAILIHKIFESIALVGILMDGNIPTVQFRVMFFVFSVATPIGALCTSFIESYVVVASDEDNYQSKLLAGVITALASGSFM